MLNIELVKAIDIYEVNAEGKILKWIGGFSDCTVSNIETTAEKEEDRWNGIIIFTRSENTVMSFDILSKAEEFLDSIKPKHFYLIEMIGDIREAGAETKEGSLYFPKCEIIEIFLFDDPYPKRRKLELRLLI